MNHLPTPENRLHALDAVRGFALLLGVAFHAALSFMPDWPAGLWAMNDTSPSPFLVMVAFVTHIFRMSLFFFIAGFFGRQMYHRLGARSFWSNRLKRILIPLLAGWAVLFPLISAVWIMGMNKVFDGTPPPMPDMPKVPGAFPLLHLWFLYQLLLLYATVIVARSLIARLDPAQRLRSFVDTAVVSSIRTMTAALTLGLPLSAALMSLPVWFYWQGIPTPDQSLIPQLPAFLGFGTAFAFGWLVQRSKGALEAVASRWAGHLVIAIAATFWLLRTMHAQPMAQPGLTKTLFALVFGAALWGWTLGLTGAALRFLSRQSPARRYIADASYWIYLAHLPVVVALQVWVGRSSVPWTVKYPFILIASLAVLFLSYHFLVRSTFIGLLLNGRRYPLKNAPGRQAPSPSLASPPPAETQGSAPVAQMRGVVKRFGATTALAGIDLDVRSGELLAVLGQNGAGKSTAIALWLGLIEPDEGEVTLFGGEPQDIARRRGLGVMLQEVELPKELRAQELIALAASYYPHPLSVEETLDRVGIRSLADRPYGNLSGGQKRQVQFAVAVCGRPRVLFLDEPTVGLDIRAREALWKNIRALLADGCSIVLTTHYLEEAEALADRVAVIAKGRVVASGSLDDVRALVARRQISCESSLDIDDVRGWPGVVEAAHDNRRLRITATDAEGVVRRLLSTDGKLTRLEVRQAGLNEALTELTREAA